MLHDPESQFVQASTVTTCQPVQRPGKHDDDEQPDKPDEAADGDDCHGQGGPEQLLPRADRSAVDTGHREREDRVADRSPSHP